MQCRGVTTTRKQCSLRAVGTDCYCKRHAFDGVPVTPSAVGWPSSRNIPRWTRSSPALWLSTITDVSKLDGLQFLRLTATLLGFRELAEQNQVLVDQCMAHMVQFPHLAQYREYFGRELSARHKDEARKKLIFFYFGRCVDLCDDMIWEVMQRV